MQPILAVREPCRSGGVVADHEPSSFDLLKQVVDPLRLAVLGSAVGQPVSISSLEDQTGASRREIAEAIGSLRTVGLLDAEGRLVVEALRSVARAMPSEGEQATEIAGLWTTSEIDMLARFFDGDRLRSIPSSATKRRLVLEFIAQRFEPGVRYHERDVNFSIQLIHPDYAAIRRYLIDEGFMDRADNAYWRIGGRHGPSEQDSGSAHAVATVIPTTDPAVTLRAYTHAMAEHLVGAANHQSISRFMSDGFPFPYTMADATDWISFTFQEVPPLNFAIFLDDELVGGVGASRLAGERTGTFEIGWWLTPVHWGRGITTAAAGALRDELFTRREAMALWAPVMGPNGASAAVARKIGMTLEGTRRSVYLKYGVRYDEMDFGLTRDRWASI